MRTTLTLSPDVAEALARLQDEQGLSQKDAVNQALRRGIPLLRKGSKRRPFTTRAVSLGPRITDVDDVAEILAQGEGDRFR